MRSDEGWNGPAIRTSPSTRTAARPAASQPQAAMQVNAVDPIRVLRQYKWWLIAAGVLGIAAGMAAYMVLKETMPRYNASAIFSAKPISSNTTVVSNTADDRFMKSFVQEEVALLENEGFAAEVLEKLPATWWQANTPKLLASMSDDPTLANTNRPAKYLADNVFSARPMNGYMFQFTVRASDPQEAAALAQRAQNLYVERAMTKDVLQIKERLSAMEGRRQTLIGEREALIEERNDMLDDYSTEQIMAVQANLVLVNREIASRRSTLQGDQVRLTGLEQARAAGVVQFTDSQREQARRDPRVISLDQQVNGLRSSLNGMRERGLSDSHSAVRRLRQQIAGVEQQREQVVSDVLAELFDAELELAQQRIDTTNKQIEDFNLQRDGLLKQQDDLNKHQTNLSSKEQEIDRKERQIEAVSDSIIALQNQEDVRQRDAVVELEIPARVPQSRSFPRLPVIMAASLAACLGLTGGIVFLREMLDQRVRGPHDVRAMPNLPLLGFVANTGSFRDLKQSSLAFRDEPHGYVADQYRQMRSPLLKRLAARGHKTLLVSAVTAEAGSTKAAVNFAYAIGAIDRKVLLIDANFRRPALDQVFDTQSAAGLSDVLSGEVSLSDAIQSTGDDSNVDVLTVGQNPSTMIERLGSTAMQELLAQAKSMYDLVILDTAPASVAGDATTLAQRCDAVALVVKALAAKRGMVSRLANDFEECGAELIGVVINRVKAEAGGYLRENMRASQAYQARPTTADEKDD